MGRQGDFITIKRKDLSRKGDYKSIDQVGVPHNHKPELTVTDNYDSSGYLTSLESRENTINEVLEALKDNEISRVAMYGMSGTGKSNLAKLVGRRAKALNMFDLVAFISVTSSPSVKKIQGDIADKLGLRLGGVEGAAAADDIAARQRRISARLRNIEERVLIILDNVWQRLNLQEIGILSDDGGQIGCKVLLTTRTREIAYLNGCEPSFHLFLLAEEEALRLLNKYAGIRDESLHDLTVVAKDIAKHCQGLPLAILVIGSVLRGKTADQCRQVLESLKNSRGDLTNNIIQMSYNGLSSKVAKTIFLMCSLFPGDHEILIEDLSQYAIRLGLIACGKSEVNAAINSLMDSGLLLMHSDTSKDHVIMHNVVRAFAMKIVSRENPAYRDSIDEYLDTLYYEKGFPWREELDRLLRQLYGESKHLSSSTRNCELPHGLGIVAATTIHHVATTIPKPSGKPVDFYGLCQVDKSFLRLLKEACARKPQLIESQRRHSEMLRQSAFDCLGRVLFLLHNVKNKDWVHHKHELQMFWEQVKVMKFDLEWLSPTVEGVLSSVEIARIEALQEEEKHWNEEAAKLREQLKIVENKAAAFRNEIAHTESKLDGFAIAQVSKAPVVPKVNPPWRRFFFMK